jgi:hypothetical protein
MRCLIIFFLFPLLSVAQIGNSNWITPIANIEFREGRINYYYLPDELNLYRLKPLFYIKDSFRMIIVPGVYKKDKTYTEIVSDLNFSVENFAPDRANSSEKHDFLQRAALMAVWTTCGHEPISESILNKLEILSVDSDSQISDEAILVKKLIKKTKH